MIPRFKTGNFDRGTILGTQAIISALAAAGNSVLTTAEVGSSQGKLYSSNKQLLSLGMIAALIILAISILWLIVVIASPATETENTSSRYKSSSPRNRASGSTEIYSVYSDSGSSSNGGSNFGGGFSGGDGGGGSW